MEARRSYPQLLLPQSTSMSLTETSRQGEEAHILPPPASFKTESGPREHTSAYPQMRMPAIPPQSAYKSSYNSYKSHPSVLHPLDYSEKHPTAPIRHILHQPNPPSPGLSPLQVSQFEFTAGNKQLKRQEDATPSTQRRQAKKISQRREMRDEDFLHLNSSTELLPTRFNAEQRPQATSSEPGPKGKEPEAPHPELNSRLVNSRPMQISELISSNNVYSPPEPRFVISLRQQPIAARACGFGERDRRVIDPPPIIQMAINDPDATPDEISTKLRYPFSVIHCELWNAETDNEETAMPEVGERRQQRRLMGTLVSSPFVGRDEQEKEGCFFCFPDLSCRTSGRYRLRFVLVVLDPTAMKPGDKSPFRATVMSEPFQVYAAKDFPGMKPSTVLTKRLKEQGCLISVKKGNEKTNAAHAREDDGEDEDDEEEAAQPSAKAKGKRAKK